MSSWIKKLIMFNSIKDSKGTDAQHSNMVYVAAWTSQLLLNSRMHSHWVALLPYLKVHLELAWIVHTRAKLCSPQGC